MKNIFKLNNILIVTIVIFLLFYISKILSASSIFEIYTKIDSLNIFIAVMFFCISFLFKFQRLALLIGLDNLSKKNKDYEKGFKSLWLLHAWSGVSSIVLPFRLGEIYRVYLLKNYLNSIYKASLIVITEKVIDLLVVLLLLIIILLGNNYFIYFSNYSYSDKILFFLFFVISLVSVFILINFIYLILVHKSPLCFTKFCVFYERLRLIVIDFKLKLKDSFIILCTLTMAIWFFEIAGFVIIYSYLSLTISHLVLIGILSLVSFLFSSSVNTVLNPISLSIYFLVSNGVINEITYNNNEGYLYSLGVYIPFIIILLFTIGVISINKKIRDQNE